MSELLSDQEQEEALRSWWRENWRWVASGVAVGFVVLAGWNYWQRQRELQVETASQTFRDLTEALATSDKDKVDAAVKKLDADHSGSPYTDQAHLLMAQAHVNGGRFEMAATDLKAVTEKTKDKALAQIAKVRLARVQIQLGHHDEALALLDLKDAGAFEAQIQETRGDALHAKGDSAGARAAYEAAITAAQAADPHSPPGGNSYLQLKLQELLASAPEQPASSAAAVPPPAK
jgi:predicted negative regulator of RcsB-dependent stress response